MAKVEFGIENDSVGIGGKLRQIISGAIHYFRMSPEQWKDRLV